MTEESRLSAAVEIFSKLTFGRVLNALALGAGAIVLYGAYEVRGEWAAQTWQSPTLWWVLGAGTVVTAVGWAIKMMQDRLDLQSREMRAMMDDRLAECHAERAAGVEELLRMRMQIIELQALDKACRERVSDLERRIDQMVRGGPT